MTQPKTATAPAAKEGLRKLSFAKAINEALHQAMELSGDVAVLGQLVDYRSGVFGTTTGLVERFGPDRVQDFPVAEASMTSAAIGAAIAGVRPVLVHQRLDFMLYSMDALVNWMALWRFKSNGKAGLPVTIRAIVGQGWGQGPQHSKSLHAWFAHLPGLKVAVPATARDVKGLLLESIFGEDPAIVIEHRSLFNMEDVVPQEPYRVRFGQAAVRRPGKDVTLAALGAMVPVALRAAQRLATESIDVEVLDLRTASPLDWEAICRSAAKTRRLAVADPAWRSVSVAAEVMAVAAERLGKDMKSNPVRITLPNSHTPMSAPAEARYYPGDDAVAAAVRTMVRG